MPSLYVPTVNIPDEPGDRGTFDSLGSFSSLGNEFLAIVGIVFHSLSFRMK